MGFTKQAVLVYLEGRKKNLLGLKDLRDRDSGFGIADNLMKHAALFEIEQAIKDIEQIEN